MMQWFKHDTDSTLDGKVKKLILKYGTDGYAIYFHCLELISGNLSESNISFQLEHDSEIIADNLKVKSKKSDISDVDYVQEIMRYMIDLSLFEDTNGHITCYKLLKRLDLSMTSNFKMRKMITDAKENHDSVMTVSCKNRIEENRIDKNNNIMSLTKVNDLPFSANDKIVTKKPVKEKKPVKRYFNDLYSWNECLNEFESITMIYWEHKTIWTQKELGNLKQLLNIYEKLPIPKYESLKQVLTDIIDYYTVHYRFTEFKIGSAKENPTPSKLLLYVNDIKFFDNKWYNQEFDRLRKKADSIDI